MKKLFILLAFLALATPGSVLSQEKPEESENGIWIKKYAIKGIDKKFYYVVDTVTENCFSIVRIGTGAGYTSIDCAKLKKRPEWKPLIPWIK